MADQKKTLEMDPELQYRLIIAALNLVGGVSANVHKQIERGSYRNRPGVSAEALGELRAVLDEVGSGGMATNVINR